MRCALISILALLPGCGEGEVDLSLRLCLEEASEVVAIELEISRSAPFNSVPADLPIGITASLGGDALVYRITPEAAGFPSSTLALTGNGMVTVLVRALNSDEIVLASSAPTMVDLSSDEPVSVAVHGDGFNPDCSPCTGGQC